MKHCRAIVTLAVLTLLFAHPCAVAQYYGEEPTSPRMRRYQREQVVARVGEVARGIVEEYDAAVKTLSACSLATARRLAEFAGDPEGLRKFPDPNQFLLVMADRQHAGDEAILWAIEHGRELRDPCAMAAYLEAPLDYALSLKNLAQGAADQRAKKLASPAGGTSVFHWRDPQNQLPLLVVGGALGLVVIAWFVRKRREMRVHDDYPPRPPMPPLRETR